MLSSSSSSSSSSCRRSLTADEIAQVNLLLPRLFLSSDHCHLATATKLATAALLTNSPPNSVSLSPLLLSLASLPSSDTSLPMSLLTRLRHSHSPHLFPSVTALAASYFRAAHPKLCSQRLRRSRAEETGKLTLARGGLFWGGS
ncbi:hypothetical protein TIFTF001_024050 [Ficus carica]|uniref:Uncharacterized protein n=1 Tax=Ficus carica TaxID=3494 RepID=A0AA88APE4_FICCA|nr:hypothetical protein TIFTF001_024050 [Ficus carica]